MLLVIVTNKLQESCIHLFLIDLSVYYYIFHLKTFLKTFDSEFSYIEVSVVYRLNL